LKKKSRVLKGWDQMLKLWPCVGLDCLLIALKVGLERFSFVYKAGQARDMISQGVRY